MFSGILFGAIAYIVIAIALWLVWGQLQEGHEYDDALDRVIEGFVTPKWLLACMLLGAVLGHICTL